MNKYLLLLSIVLLLGCKNDFEPNRNLLEVQSKECDGKIPVLNFGTFHFLFSTDANTSFIDINDQEVVNEIRELNLRIAKFKPTVILTEETPEKNAKLQTKYKEYVSTNDSLSTYGGEVGLVAFEVGKLSDCERIYGIDDHEFRNYDYRIGDRNQQNINDPTFAQIKKESKEWDRIESLPVIERLSQTNTEAYRNFMININMDDLHYVNSDGTFDATDQALRLYHRNARWFANVNKIELDTNDRVFILGGAAHTAFLHDMFERSPKFCLVNVEEVLTK